MIRVPFARTLAAPLLASAVLAATALPAPAQSFTDAQKEAVEGIVRDYLLKNPEIIMEAIEVLQAREKVAQEEQQRQALSKNRKALFEDPASPVAGNPKGDVTVVEFFDYQCGYCKTVQADVQKLLKDDGKVRFVFKEFPILSAGSALASKAALASRAQGKYVEFHNALMAHRGQFDEDVVMRLARSVGLDTDKLKAEMEKPEIREALAANHKLAEALGLRGTPAFVIGNEIVPGAIKLDEMKRLVAAARKG